MNQEIFIPGKLTVVIDASGGSSGKGSLGSFLTMDNVGKYQFVCNTFAHQASHWVYDRKNDKHFCYKQFNSCAHRHEEFEKMYIGHGGVISLKALFEEIEFTGIPDHKLGISPITPVTIEIDRLYEEGKVEFSGKPLDEMGDGTIGTGCFTSSTVVLMADGSYKNINLIKKGDRVINMYGKPVVVSRAFSTGYKDVIEIKNCNYHKKYKVTKDHLYYVGDIKGIKKRKGIGNIIRRANRTSWKSVGSLDLSNTKLLTPSNIEFDMPKSFKIDLNDYSSTAMDTGDNNISSSWGNGNRSFNRNLEPSYDLGYIFGCFLGDGCSNIDRNRKTGKTSFYLHRDDTEAASKLKSAFMKVVGVELSEYARGNMNVYICYNKAISFFFDSFKKQPHKKLPKNYLIDDHDYLSGLLDGMIDTGGHITERGSIVFTNVSEGNIELFQFLMMYFSIPFGSSTRKNSSVSKNKNFIKYDHTKWNKSYDVQGITQNRVSGDMWYSDISYIGEETFFEETFDIEVDCESHSFIANNVIVHNSTCSGVGASRARKILRDKNLLLARDVPELQKYLCDVPGEIMERLENGQSGLLEVAQGFQLSYGLPEFYPNCLSGASKILMSDGKTKSMKDVSIGDEVITMDAYNRPSKNKIINKFIRNRDGDKLYNIITETTTWHDYSKAYIGGEYTANHKIMTTRGEVCVSDIMPGDEVYNNEYNLTDASIQVLLGSMLGDGTICDMAKNTCRSRFEETHSVKQLDYLKFKRDILSRIIGGDIREIICGSKSFKPGEVYYRYESSTSSNIMKFAKKYGCLGKKEPDMDAIVKDMDWRAIAVWYSDDGSLKKSVTRKNGKSYYYDYVRIFTNGFSYESNQRLASLLKDKFGIDFSVAKGRPHHLELKITSNDAFFNGIKNYMTECMLYKIPEKYLVDYEFLFSDEDGLTYSTEKILSVEEKIIDNRSKRGKRHKVYDIEVENDHNFFVGNDKGYINVHNCTSRNVTVAAALDDMMLPITTVGNVVINNRTYPIRIASKKYISEDGTHLTWDQVQSGNYKYQEVESFSGTGYDDQVEITWEDVEKHAGEIPMDVKLTSLTKLPRRVFTFSKQNLYDAIRYNQTNYNVIISVNFINWVDVRTEEKTCPEDVLTKEVRDWLHENILSVTREFSNVYVGILGTSRYTEDKCKVCII